MIMDGRSICIDSCRIVRILRCIFCCVFEGFLDVIVRHADHGDMLLSTRRGRGDFQCWRATVGTCPTISTLRRFVSHLVLLDESIISYAWMANTKGAGGIMTGTSVRVAF